MSTLEANESWRNDPVRRENARNLCQYRTVHLSKLLKALREAKEESLLLRHSGYKVPYFGADIERLEQAHLHFSTPTETLIGNMAAFGEGTE